MIPAKDRDSSLFTQEYAKELFEAQGNIITGAQPKAGTGLKMQTVSVSRFFNVTLLGIYRWLRYVAGSLKSYPPFWKARGMEDSQEKDYSFLGKDTFPSLYDALVYERKFKSEYLERQIYERSLKSEPSIVKLIENKRDLSKLSTLSEPSIVKFIENQSELIKANFISS